MQLLFKALLPIPLATVAFLWTQTPVLASSLGPYSVIAEKDIFDPSRGLNRSSKDGGSQALSQDDVRRQIELFGVVITEGKKTVFIRNKMAAKADASAVSALAEGESIGGWKIEEIREKEVVLKQGAQKVVLPVFPKESKDKLPVGVATPHLPAVGTTTAPKIPPTAPKGGSNYRIKRLAPSSDVPPGSTYRNSPLVQRMLKGLMKQKKGGK